MPRRDSTPPRRRYTDVQRAPERGCDKQEKATAEAIDGARTRGSGSGPRPAHKGDVLGKYQRAECKTTGNASLPIERVWLEKIRLEAAATGDAPMFVFGFDARSAFMGEFTGRKFEATSREDWAAFPLATARNMSRAIAALLKGDITTAQDYARLTVGRNGR